MRFGKTDNIEHIDFSLPPDHPLTAQLLSALRTGKKSPLKFYLGCAKWARKDWLGKLYPEGTREKDFLKQYAHQFNAIELNALFYKLQPPAVIAHWAEQAPIDFRFSPKFTRSISHLYQLKTADQATTLFIDHMQGFGKKLGWSFLQLSDRFAPNRAEILKHYLENLPRDFKTCVELRHPDWFIPTAIPDSIFKLCRRLKIGTVITDAAGRRDCLHMRLTAPVAFIRFVGNDLHPTDFLRINDWAERIRFWIDQGLREIYFYIHNHDEAYTPELCKYAIEQFNQKCGTKLKPVVLQKKKKQRKKK